MDIPPVLECLLAVKHTQSCICYIPDGALLHQRCGATANHEFMLSSVLCLASPVAMLVSVPVVTVADMKAIASSGSWLMT